MDNAAVASTSAFKAATTNQQADLSISRGARAPASYRAGGRRQGLMIDLTSGDGTTGLNAPT